MVAKTNPLTIASLCKLNDLSVSQPEKVLAKLQEKHHVAGNQDEIYAAEYAMSEQSISAEDEARNFQVMTDYNDLMRSLHHGPVPMCHFTPMTQHWDDSHPASDSHWYECAHCGHTLDSADAWARVRNREVVKKPAGLAEKAEPSTDNELF